MPTYAHRQHSPKMAANLQLLACLLLLFIHTQVVLYYSYFFFLNIFAFYGKITCFYPFRLSYCLIYCMYGGQLYIPRKSKLHGYA
jgi:hypothetical protein